MVLQFRKPKKQEGWDDPGYRRMCCWRGGFGLKRTWDQADNLLKMMIKKLNDKEKRKQEKQKLKKTKSLMLCKEVPQRKANDIGN